MTDTDTLYCNPSTDAEWPIFGPEDKCETCGLTYKHYDTPGARTTSASAGHFCLDCNESYPVKVVFNLDGARGHYLAADFIASTLDYLRDTRHTFTIDRIECLLEAEKSATNYRKHNELSSPDTCTDKDDESCTCNHIHDEADYVQDILTDLGYLVMWNDGVYVYQSVARSEPTD